MNHPSVSMVCMRDFQLDKNYSIIVIYYSCGWSVGWVAVYNGNEAKLSPICLSFALAELGNRVGTVQFF